jgi:hypothetical protein
MHVITRQGTKLSVHLAAIHRIPAGHPQPIVEFRYSGGILCSSYYLSDLQQIPPGNGLCLAGGTIARQELDPEAVTACQQQCQAWMAEISA